MRWFYYTLRCYSRGSLLNDSPAYGTPILRLEPRFDALRVELVKACKRQDLFVTLIVSHANRAVVLLSTLLLSCTAVTFLLATRVATPW